MILMKLNRVVSGQFDHDWMITGHSEERSQEYFCIILPSLVKIFSLSYLFNLTPKKSKGPIPRFPDLLMQKIVVDQTGLLLKYQSRMMNEANETIFNNWREFIHRETEKIINLNLEHKPYDSLKSQELIGIISQQIIDKLTSTNKNFKYIVNVVLLAKGGNGFDLGGLSYYNSEMDGTLSVKWESKFLTCIAIIYGVAN